MRQASCFRICNSREENCAEVQRWELLLEAKAADFGTKQLSMADVYVPVVVLEPLPAGWSRFVVEPRLEGQHCTWRQPR